MGALKETLKKIKQARPGYDDDRGTKMCCYFFPHA